MKSVKDITANELEAEGRRWVLYPGERDMNGVRGEMVFEDYPLRFTVGLVSNSPTTKPPIYLEGDDPNEAAINWSLQNLDFIESEEDWHTIVNSSIHASILCRKIRVVLDTDSDGCRISNDYGDEMDLSYEQVKQLYGDLARAYGLPCYEKESQDD